MRVRIPWRSLAALLCVVALVGAGCGNDDDGEVATPGDDTEQPAASGDNTASIEMIDYGYVIDGSLQEGWTTFDVSNTGDEYHMIGMGRMKEGVTLDDVVSTFSEPPPGEDGGDGGEEAPPGEGEGEGGDPFEALFEGELEGPPGGFLAPGESVSMTTDGLDAGVYALICFVETPEGEPHFAKGMISEITVEESEELVGAVPEADVTVDISSEAITMPSELEAGEHTFEVNLSGGEHEFAFIRYVDEDATFEELDEYFARFDEGVLPTADTIEDGPAVFTGFVFSVLSDTTYYVTKELTAGQWAIGCTLEEFHGETEQPGRDHAQTEIQVVTVT